MRAVIGHLIDGRRRDAGSAFEAPTADGARSYARAGDRDVDAALASLVPGRPPAERILDEAVRLVAEDDVWREDLAAALLGDRVAELPERLGRVRSHRRQSGHLGTPSVTLLAAHWTDGAGELGRRLLGALASGAAVLLASDTRLPEAADVWVDALLDAGLDERRVALLHGCDARRVARHPAAPARARIMVDDSEAADAVRALVGERRWALDWPRARARRAGEHGCRTPREAFASAFGADTLGGLLPGRTGVLDVAEHDHARWIDALVPLVDRALAAAKEHPRGEPVPPVDAALRRRFEGAVRRLLEQGATPVALGERRGEAAFAPTLFVNGEPWMETVKVLPCVPVLVVRRRDEPADGSSGASRTIAG